MFLIFAIFLTLNAAWAKMYPPQFSRQTNPAPTFLDQHRDRYLQTEETLWHQIASGSEQAFALQQVHSGHNAFLRASFLENGSPLSTFDPEQRILFEAIARINESRSITVDNYLIGHTRQYRNERDLLGVATHNKNLLFHFDKIFDVTGTGDFYKTIQSVSVLLFTI